MGANCALLFFFKKMNSKIKFYSHFYINDLFDYDKELYFLSKNGILNNLIFGFSILSLDLEKR